MFTVLSNSRSSNLYLIAALAATAAVLVSFTLVPAISAPRPAGVPVTSVSDNSADYYQRHPELNIAGLPAAELQSDFYQRHPEWIENAQVAAVPVTGAPEGSDYFERHSDLGLAVANTANTDADFYLRHPDWESNVRSADLNWPLRPIIIPLTGVSDISDYFQRHSPGGQPAETNDLSDYFLRH